VNGWARQMSSNTCNVTSVNKPMQSFAVAMVEPLERRALCSGAPVAVSSPPPRVEAAYVGGTAWNQPFRDFLAAMNLGSSAFGARVAFPTHAAIEPWVNLDQISVTFSSDMEVGIEDLRVRGVGSSDYSVSGFQYELNESTFQGTATWTIGGGGFLRPDRLVFEIDADAETGGVVQRTSRVPLDGDGDLIPGGDFRLNLFVVPGDAGGGDGIVSPSDFRTVRAKLFSTSENPGTGYASYNPFCDLDGNGRIGVTDLAHVRRRMYDRLPRPTVSLAPSMSSSVTADLFSAVPILA